MKDTEIRGILLRKYYERRRERHIQLAYDDFEGQLSDKDIVYVSDQLAEHGLIDWDPFNNRGELVGGFGHITAFGVDVVENKDIDTPIKIVFDQRSNISIADSSHVQVGNENIQNVVINIRKLITDIDNSDASDKDKKEAKERLKSFIEHPLVTSILGGLSGTIFT